MAEPRQLWYFNPRSPCGERHLSRSCGPSRSRYFNPRSPCGERRESPGREHTREATFQSTLPVWGATHAISAPDRSIGISIHAPRVGSDEGDRGPGRWLVISIHAPRVGSDPERLRRLREEKNFNPRSPCGERLYLRYPIRWYTYFNQRSPCGERLHFEMTDNTGLSISIHAPRVGSDAVCGASCWWL